MKVSVLFAAATFLTRGIHAMRPVPFDEEYTFDAPSGVKLVSTNSEGGGLSTDGVTKVFGADGSILYEMPVFTGRRHIYLSPNGSIIVLDGNIYFGTDLMRPTSFSDGEDQVITSIYLNGNLWKDIMYDKDLNGKPVKELYGGGWAKRPFTLDVSWERNVLTYDMPGNASERRKLSLPGAH